SFNSFQIIWKDKFGRKHSDPLNPFTMTLRHSLEELRSKSQCLNHIYYGADELIHFECNFEKCLPPLSTADMTSRQDVLLADIYKQLKDFPHVQVTWTLDYCCVVPYKRTIDCERSNTPKFNPKQITCMPSDERRKFNPLLYESDFYRLKQMNESFAPDTARVLDHLKVLMHEVIKNGYLRDLISQHKNAEENGIENEIKKEEEEEKKIKCRLHFNKKNPEQLILDDNVLTILHEVKELYHSDIHKHIGYPLQLHHICAIMLYCGKECNVEFSYDQIQFKYNKWAWLDWCLRSAISILCMHERREETSMELYCGLKGVRLESLEKEIKAGNFISHVSTSDDLQVAQIYRTDQGCILHFHPSMRRATNIQSCDVTWITPFKHEREILFSRSFVENFGAQAKQKHVESKAWNAKVESEDHNTQMILLTWTKYDQFIQQTMQISAMWNHSIDLNIIFIGLNYQCNGDVDEVMELMSDFKEWKEQESNVKKYKLMINEFVEHRCCNHYINLFCLFLEKSFHNKNCNAVEFAKIVTLSNGLPYDSRDKERWQIEKNRKGRLKTTQIQNPT
ncbi:hypothetical protein RFI_28646, partial [Reticulomyxa filosa]